MKSISHVCLMILFVIFPCKGDEEASYSPYRDQEVRGSQLVSSDLHFRPDKAELEKQDLFLQKVREALAKVGLPGIAIDVVFYENEAADSLPRLYRLPKFVTSTQPYMLRMKRSAILGDSELVLLHKAYYVLCSMKNGDLSGTNLAANGQEVDEAEMQRRAEYTVFKTVGWDTFKEFILANFDPDHTKSKSEIRSCLIDEQRFLGIWDQFSKDLIPLSPEKR